MPDIAKPIPVAPQTVFSELSKFVDPALTTNLFNYTGNFILHLAPLVLSVAIVYFLSAWLQYYNRGLDEVVVDYSKKMLFWLLITALAANQNNYIHLANMIFHAPEEIASWFFSNKELTATFLDQVSDTVTAVVSKIDVYSHSLSVWQISYVISAFAISIIINLLSHIFLATCFAFYMIAKISLAITLLVGPFFLMCLIFPAVRQWGMNWIGQIVSYILTVIFYALINFIFSNYLKNFLSHFLEATKAGPVTDILIFQALCVKLVIIFVLFLIVLFKLPRIASALTGGISIEEAISGAIRSVAILRIAGRGGIGGSNIMQRTNITQRSNPPQTGATNSMKPGGK